MPTFKYRGVVARQSGKNEVVTFAARASDVLAFASISRAARPEGSSLQGFQRPQCAAHIREIQHYLQAPDAVLPNSIVVGFIDGIKMRKISDEIREITIDARDGPKGYIIDGQQRLIALEDLDSKDFELFVSVLVCPNIEELRRQFVLINSARPLPKALIYELLPDVAELPPRLSSRSVAAALTERLNFEPTSSLRGEIYQYTNPKGVIRDTAIQKVIMHSVSDGAIGALPQEARLAGGYHLLSEFFAAVKNVFKEDWEGRTPKSSRLVHGAGIQALGFVMEHLVARNGAQTRADFSRGLVPLRGRTAWTSGTWRFSPSEQIPWNKLENTSRHVTMLAEYLVKVIQSGTQDA